MNRMEHTKLHIAIIANMCSLISSFVTGRGANGAVSFRIYVVIGCCLSFGALEMQMLGIVLEGPVSRSVQDRKKTGPRPVFNEDCSLGLSNFKTKDCKKTGPYGPV